ncbi:MAG: GNAT family N-acetyltransferase [Dokdonella sp.]
MDNTLAIRDASRADIAFLVDSNAAMALETEHKVLDRALLAPGVAAVFDHPARGFYLIAEDGPRALGCLLITSEWSDWRNGMWWWLQSVYVIAAARRRGVFRALYSDVERRAAATENVIGLRLYVERENLRAQATYAERGMQETPYRLYESEFASRSA